MKSKIIYFVLIFTLVIGIVSALPGVPHQFYGNVEINNKSALDNQIITAVINGNEYSVITLNGKYGYSQNTLIIPDLDSDLKGELIEFYIGESNKKPIGSFIFSNNGYTELDFLITTTCGDGYCLGDETCSSCPSDCGSCNVDNTNNNPRGGGGPGGNSPSGNNNNNGGGLIGGCEESWKCEPWSECIDGKKTRDCQEVNNCGTEELKPLIETNCLETNLNEINSNPVREFFSRITGAVIGGGNAKYSIPLAFILVLIIAGIVINIKRKKSNSEDSSEEVVESEE